MFIISANFHVYDIDYVSSIIFYRISIVIEARMKPALIGLFDSFKMIFLE